MSFSHHPRGVGAVAADATIPPALGGQSPLKSIKNVVCLSVLCLVVFSYLCLYFFRDQDGAKIDQKSIKNTFFKKERKSTKNTKINETMEPQLSTNRFKKKRSISDAVDQRNNVAPKC